MSVRLGAGSAGFIQGGTKDACIPVLGILRPLESGVLGLGVFYCSLSSLCRVSWLKRLAWATPPQLLPPGATRRWRSTVCSASVLQRKWGDAAGSRGGPGPVERQGRMRYVPRLCGPPLICCEEMVPGLGSHLCCSLTHFPTSLTALMCLPICSSRGHCRDEDG